MIKVIVFLVLIYGRCCHVCDDQYSIRNVVQNCFDKELIDISIPLESNLNTTLEYALGIDVICNNSAAYIRASLCASNISRTCIRHNNISEDILPSAKQFQESTPYICSNYKDMNYPCIKSHLQEVYKCAIDQITKTVSGTPLDKDPLKIICLSHSISQNCASFHIHPCGIRSRLIYKKYSQFSLPVGCQEKDPLIG